jgi:hypothetical protein
MYSSGMALAPPPGSTRFTVRAEGGEADAIRQAAEALGIARHPGMAELLNVRLEPAGAVLELTVPDGVPLLGLALSLEEVAGVVATIATTIADLHDIGVVVGSVSLDGVLVTPDGHAVLTDVAHTVRLAGRAPRWPEHPLARRDDRELGRLLADLLDASVPSAVADILDAPPAWARLLRRRDAPGAIVRRLAERAAGGAVGSRRLAEGLATDVPGACLPRRTAAREHLERDVAAGPSDEALDRWFGTEHPPAPQPAAVATAAAATAAGADAAATVRRSPQRHWPLLVAAATTAVVLLAVGRPSSASSPSPACAPPGRACPAYRDGILSVDGARYAVGARGDVAVTGRWSCGAALLALLRPATGAVWVYGTWPAGAASISPTLSAVIDGARRLAVVAGDHCDTLDVVRQDGTRLPLHVGGAP